MADNKASSSLYSKAVTANVLKDNGATVLWGGNIATDGPVTNAPDTTVTDAGRADQPSVQESAYTGATNAQSTGNFATMPAGHYIVKGGNITTNLAGVAYTGLQSGANPNQIRGLHTLLTRKTVLIDSWNYATGAATANAGNPSSDDFGASYTDPTRAIPGNLVFIEDGSNTETKAYTGV